MLNGAALGAPDTQSVMSAYSTEHGSLHLKSSFIPEFDGFAVTSRSIASPAAGQVWYLLYGPNFGFNGTLIRFHIYSFDGQGWKRIWAPEDARDGEIIVSGNTIYLSHIDLHQYYQLRRPPFTRRDTYRISAEDVGLISSDLQAE